MTIGERIRKRRLELGMSQEELAKKLDYKSRSSINKIEKDGKGLRQNKIVVVAKALQTSPQYILGWIEEEPNRKEESKMKSPWKVSSVEETACKVAET